ncbi:MAG: hypothetical protein QM687_06720 [Ferruginibacter sp.]
MKLIEYVLAGEAVSNPDGSLPAQVKNCTVVAGPGAMPQGNYPNALDFGSNGKISVTLPVNDITSKQFCIRTVFKIDQAVTERFNLVESGALPFAIFLDKASGSNDFSIDIAVAPKVHGWSGTSSRYFQDLKLNKWYTADLVYDMDTVGLFIDGSLVSVHAFPKGGIQKFSGNRLYIGTWVDGSKYHFPGQMAAVTWFDDEIPAELEKQLDERRSHAEWFLSYKYEAVKATIGLGNITGKYVFNYEAGAYQQLYEGGLLMYQEGIGAAFEMHGDIFKCYQQLQNKSSLGYLVSDEGNGLKSGSRKNIFSKGGIYWSAQTGAVPVTGQMFLDYENIGEASYLGLPTAPAKSIANGYEQVFQSGRMYYKNGATNAHEVHGAILTKFLSSGSTASWGFPVSNESDVKRNSTVIGKYSDFESCTIYWSGATGAFEVHGDIRQKYRDINGPLGSLGFPTSDEGNIPGASGAARYNTFQEGSILWFGSAGNMYVCTPFKIYLGRINSKESEGWLRGQNDLYLRTLIRENGTQIFNKRFPNSGDYSGKNIVDINQTLNATIKPNSPNKDIKFTVDIWESDWPDGDEHLGIYNKTLNMANAWGMAENNGVFNSGSFSMINSITWAVHPQVNINTLSIGQKWWGLGQNPSTPTLSYSQYASAFRDVDSESEWWDLTDWLEKAFYELVCKGLASNGNCFGQSLEAINAWKGKSIFSLPIDRFTSWNTIKNEINIKHQYQVGASALWWFVGQFLTGNTHDPVDVFKRTRDAFNSNCNPVVCIAQNWDFSGAPHAIMPYSWDTSSKPWKMGILDPNNRDPQVLYVDPDKNEFNYKNGKYKGAEWSGGRFHYMPYSVLNERPRTPIWDAIMLLLTGTVIILGSDTYTTSLTDENGTDLDAFGTDSIRRMKQGKALDNKFVSMKGFDAKAARVLTKAAAGRAALSAAAYNRIVAQTRGILASEMYMRSEKGSGLFTPVRPGMTDVSVAKGLTMAELMNEKAVAKKLSRLSADASLFNTLKDRELGFIANDKKMLSALDRETAGLIRDLYKTLPVEKNFIHKMSGLTNGNFQYAIKNKLQEFMFSSSVKRAEAGIVNVKDLGTAASVVNLTTTQDKTVKLEINNKLGVNDDTLKITIDKIPAAAGKELMLNIKPGLSGLDILTTAEKVNARVSIEANMDNKTIKRTFGVEMEGGVRIRPAMALDSPELKVAKIEALFGQTVSSKIIKGT